MNYENYKLMNANGFRVDETLVREYNATLKSDFKVGDMVECINNHPTSLLRVGKLYTITKVRNRYVEVDNCTLHRRVTCSPDMLRLIVSAPQESDFKVGDRVECINNHSTNSLKVGRSYTITQCGRRYVEVDNCTLCSPDRFKLITPKPQTNFKIGDVVECVDGNCTNLLKVGKSYKITECNSGFIQVDNCILCDPNNLKLITPKPQISKFKIGDRVEIVDKKQNYSTYTRFLVDNNLSQRIIDEYIENYTTPNNGTLCNILYTKDSVAVVILDDKRIAIIGESGLKVANTSKERVQNTCGIKVAFRNGDIGEIGLMRGHEDGVVVTIDEFAGYTIFSLNDYDNDLKYCRDSGWDIVKIFE